jgi:hypothetical protein
METIEFKLKLTVETKEERARLLDILPEIFEWHIEEAGDLIPDDVKLAAWDLEVE